MAQDTSYYAQLVRYIAFSIQIFGQGCITAVNTSFAHIW